MSELNIPAASLPHPRALAFLGDAVFELFLREWAVAKGHAHSKALHTLTTLHANAAAQVALLYALDPLLTSQEKEWVRQGRNAGASGARRASQAAHRTASGFEALLGALHLTDKARLLELLDAMIPHLRAIEAQAAVAESEKMTKAALQKELVSESLDEAVPE